jgi:uncharacterized membrane protein
VSPSAALSISRPFMKYLSVIILIVCAAIFVAVTVNEYERMPEKMASQFDGDGQATSWMGKAAFFRLMVTVGVGMPLLPLAAMYALRFLPLSWLNLPEYWKQPETFPRLCRFLFASTLWYSAGFLLWQTGLMHLVAKANLATPPQLNSGLMLILTVALLLLTFTWILVLLLGILAAGRRAFSAA